MRKQRLRLDDLTVQSFSTGSGMQSQGTVRARAATEETCRGQATCGGGGDTCWDSCDGVCGSYYCATNGASCGAETCIWSCAWTGCGNCELSVNEVGSCSCTCNCG